MVQIISNDEIFNYESPLVILKMFQMALMKMLLTNHGENIKNMLQILFPMHMKEILMRVGI